MKEKSIFLFLVATMFLLSTILFTNIGYAKENTVHYKVNNLYQEFNVEFNQKSKNIDNNINIINSHQATLSNIILTKVGERQTFKLPVINTSRNASAKLEVTVLNSNTEFFKVTCQTSKSILKEKSDEVILEINVELIKTPIHSSESTEISIDITAEPIYKAS